MKNIDVTFMFCNWYSGGTLFSIILNDSSSIVCNGEVFPWQGGAGGTNNDCSCGEILSKCDFYNYCASEMKKDGEFDLDVFRVLPKFSNIKIINRYLNSYFLSPKLKKNLISSIPALDKNLSMFLDKHVEFIKKALEFEGKSIYVDGTKNIRRAEFFTQAKNINLKAVHLVRDGRGFCNSWVKNRGVSKDEGLKIAAADWNSYILQVDEYSSRYPDIPILTVRYEDLCANLELQKTKIQEFLGVNGKWGEVGGSKFHILGNRMRRTFSGEIQQDLSWQTELSEEQIEQIESVMKKQLKRYDYI